MPVPALPPFPCSPCEPTLTRSNLPSCLSRTKASSRWLVSPGTTLAELLLKAARRPSADSASASDWNLGSSTQQGPLPPSIRKSAPVRRLTTCATELLVASLGTISHKANRPSREIVTDESCWELSQTSDAVPSRRSNTAPAYPWPQKGQVWTECP